MQAQAKSEGTDNALMQIEQGADPQLMDAIQATRRFDLVARSDMPSVLKEQDLTQSGNVNVMDPQARQFLTRNMEGFLFKVGAVDEVDTSKQGTIEH